MLGPIGTPELVIILVVVLLIFGVGRISGVGRELGSSIKEFRRAVKDEDKEGKEDDAKATVQQTQAQQPEPQQQVQAPPPAPSSQSSNSTSESSTQEPQKNIF